MEQACKSGVAPTCVSKCLIVSPNTSSVTLPYDKMIPFSSEAMFLAGVTGMSMVFGFGYAVAMAKKKDPDGFIQVK